MSVDVRRMVETMGASLMGGQVLTLSSDYQQGTGFTLGTLLLFAAQEWEQTAERFVRENAALRGIFATAEPVVRDRALRERVAVAAGSQDPSLRISELRSAHKELRALLIDLHAHVEQLDDPQAAELDVEIWRELAASTERRLLPGSPF